MIRQKRRNNRYILVCAFIHSTDKRPKNEQLVMLDCSLELERLWSIYEIWYYSTVNSKLFKIDGSALPACAYVLICGMDYGN